MGSPYHCRFNGDRILGRYLIQEIRRLAPPVPVFRIWGLVALIVLMATLAIMPEALKNALTLKVNQPTFAAFWGAHFVHLNAHHLMMNLAGFSVIWLLTVAFLPLRLMMLLTVCLPPMVSGLLVLFPHSLESYRGFSGILYGYWLCGVIVSWPAQRLVASACAVVLVGKVVVEQLPGFDQGYLLESIGGLVAVDAHMWGALAGAAITIVVLAFNWLKVGGLSNLLVPRQVKE